MNFKKILIFLFGFALILKAQTKIIDEKNNDNILSYVIQFNIDDLDLKNYFDESKPGELALLKNDVFLALPNLSVPKISYEILEEFETPQIPKFNPITEIINNKIVYKEVRKKSFLENEIMIIKGYLWLKNNYCLHLSFSPYKIVKDNKINHISKILLKLEFKENISSTLNKIKSNETVNEIIFNKNFAENNILLSEKKFPQNSEDWFIDDYSYVQIKIAEDGIYRLNKTELEQIGVNVSNINPQKFKLILKGKEIPIYIPGEEDGFFDENDYIEFLGLRNMGGNHRELSKENEPYNEYLGRYTDTTTYWLAWQDEDGKRVKIFNNSSLNINDTINYYYQTEHYEKNNWFDFSMQNQARREQPFWTENKTWHEGNLNMGIRKRPFTATDIYPNKTSFFYVKLQDYASNITENAHLISLSINNSGIWSDSVSVNKYEKALITHQVNSNSLTSSNQLLINSIPTDATINTCIFDWYEVEYPRYLIPIDSKLVFQFDIDDVENNIKLLNITSGNYSIWKVGDSYKKFGANLNGKTLSFADTIYKNDKYIYSDISQIKTPKISYKNKLTNLISTENQADYIIITHKKFVDKSKEYADFITENYNLKTTIIDVEDIYNQFSYGFFNPEAIKDFLMATHSYWQSPKPKYVFFIGGATYDYHGNKYKNFVSIDYRVKNYVPSFGAPVSDNWFVTWDTTGAYIPQMNIGRIPVTENEQIDRYINKHKNYLTQKYDDWNKRYFYFSSGNSSSESELFTLRASNQFVIDNYTKTKPIGGNYFHFYKTVDPQTNFGPIDKNEFQDEIDKGAMLISYIGHSGTRIWDNSITKVEQVKNSKERYPIVSDFGCSTGKFAEPDVTSFSELFTIGEEGQALAYLGNTSLGFVSTSVLSPKIFYKKILQDKIYNISEAHKQAKLEILQNYGSSDVYKLFALTNTLIGDPILSVPVPTKPNFVFKQNDFKIFPEVPTDLDEKTTIKIPYYNYGIVPSDTVSISIINKYKNRTDTTYLEKVVPSYNDTLDVNVLTKNKVGLHNITILLDPQNKFEEIYENDNRIDFNFNVLSSSIRPILASMKNSMVNDKLLFLNPTNKPINEKFVLEYSSESALTNVVKETISFDTIYSTFNTKNLSDGERAYGRAKIEGTENFSPIFSFTKGSSKYSINDSLSMTADNILNLEFNREDVIHIDSSYVNFNLFSAGFTDGQAAVIERNDTNFVTTTAIGHHVSLFDVTPPYNFVEYKYFNTYVGGENITNYINFLDTLSQNRLIVIAVCMDGRITDVNLKNKLKELGSMFIDDLKFRGSWLFFGEIGNNKKKYSEKLSNTGDGPVSLDTVFSYLNTSGTLTTNKIGPSSHWKNITVSDSLLGNSSISYRPILLGKNEETIDTLSPLVFTNGFAEIKNIDAEKYPYIKLLTEFSVSNNNQSPMLKSIAADYIGVPELAINYQVVEIDKDTVNQGEDLDLSFSVYNVGEAIADSITISVDAVKKDNTKERIFNTVVDSIEANGKKKFNLKYKPDNFISMTKLTISIDENNKILELFEDNNYYDVPVYFIGDTIRPKVNITVDGNNIFDGDFVSNKPEIKIELIDESLLPLADTSFISLILNNKTINYSGNENRMKINYSQTNPKITLKYTPELEDGDYSLTVLAKDASGNLSDSSGITKYFKVQSEHKLLNVYNYPNPFKSDTYFTFKLTQIPDEVKIKVFTISGRMIKEIILNSSQLNNDLNKIYWDSRDEDGDLIGNGIYLYKIIMSVNGKKQDVTQKMAVVR